MYQPRSWPVTRFLEIGAEIRGIRSTFQSAAKVSSTHPRKIINEFHLLLTVDLYSIQIEMGRTFFVGEFIRQRFPD